jgi:hypothetical protein
MAIEPGRIYGKRARPDAYPHEIYKYDRNGHVKQFVHGRWWPVGILKENLQEDLEKGLLWELQNGKYSWNSGEWFTKLNCRVAIHKSNLESTHDARRFVVSCTRCTQSKTWFIVQQSAINTDSYGSRKVEQLQTWYFNNEQAAMKRYKALARDLSAQLAPGHVVISVPAPAGHKEPLSWDQRLKKAATAKKRALKREEAEAEEAKRAAAREAEERSKRERESKLQQLIDRLRELTEKPRADLTSDEYREKMKLKRELRDVEC